MTAKPATGSEDVIKEWSLSDLASGIGISYLYRVTRDPH